MHFSLCTLLLFKLVAIFFPLTTPLALFAQYFSDNNKFANMFICVFIAVCFRLRFLCRLPIFASPPDFLTSFFSVIFFYVVWELSFGVFIWICPFCTGLPAFVYFLACY